MRTLLYMVAGIMAEQEMISESLKQKAIDQYKAALL